MYFTHKALLLTAGILGSSLVSASTATVALTNETVKGDANFDMGTYGVDAGFSYDKDESISTGYIGLGIEDSDPTGPLQVGLGARIYGIDTDLKNDSDISVAIALGGWYRYTIPEANRLSIFGSLYYAPESLSLTNLNHMYVYEVRAEYMTMKNARAFVSYGKTRIVYDNAAGTRKEANNGFAVGATVEF
ncbi:hypothetical protein KDW99_10195 [Marinomonas rhizomae]|uniref:YfaZ family outer membrane protein n=1 Tax=Marinomonas rhizomae TaxID=491948 RepID=UPI00210611DB|nr:YfaZ family outer membrane protein [Marinomonas rhizomae]UTW01476.1 hypothetical protein KDW99_10195 [Marinomonas rhizomae]